MGTYQALNLKPKDSNTLLLTKISTAFLIVLAMVGSNFLTYYILCSKDSVLIPRLQHRNSHAAEEDANLLQIVDGLLKQLNHTELHLQSTQKDLLDVRSELSASRKEFSQVFLSALSDNMQLINASNREIKDMVAVFQKLQNSDSDIVHSSDEEDPWVKWASWMKEMNRNPGKSELAEVSATRPLPLGYNPGQESDSMVSSMGHACALQEEDLNKFMEYPVGGQCPDDHNLEQRLLLRGCEPLPRRRCFAVVPANFSEPYAIPKSYWKLPLDGNILWTPYRCKSFRCLNERKKLHVMDDCNDCFDLEGSERSRWDRHGRRDLDFSIEEALGEKQSSIRIGLDIGGGSGSFAVRMAERGITIVTTTMNLNGPFNNFIALRGVVPLYITVAQRLPFFDNTLDIVHSMHVLSHWIPLRTFEFLLFDIDRVLRPGGLFWLDHFFCKKAQFEEVYLPLIRSLGFTTRKWVTGPKLDRETEEILYLSAVLEKPMRPRRLSHAGA